MCNVIRGCIAASPAMSIRTKHVHCESSNCTRAFTAFPPGMGPHLLFLLYTSVNCSTDGLGAAVCIVILRSCSSGCARRGAFSKGTLRRSAGAHVSAAGLLRDGRESRPVMNMQRFLKACLSYYQQFDWSAAVSTTGVFSFGLCCHDVTHMPSLCGHPCSTRDNPAVSISGSAPTLA